LRICRPLGRTRKYPCCCSDCAARLQTLDHGAPVSVYSVGRELGHGGEALVRRVYGHLGTVRHRAEMVEYRVEQYRDALGDRLTALAELAPLLAPPRSMG
jgi:hypothetical protein